MTNLAYTAHLPEGERPVLFGKGKGKSKFHPRTGHEGPKRV